MENYSTPNNLITVRTLVGTSDYKYHHQLTYLASYGVDKEMLADHAVALIGIDTTGNGTYYSERYLKYLSDIVKSYLRAANHKHGKLLAVIMDDLFVMRIVDFIKELASHIGKSLCCNSEIPIYEIKLHSWVGDTLTILITFAGNYNKQRWLNNNRVGTEYSTPGF